MLRYRFRGIQVGFKSERKATQEAGERKGSTGEKAKRWVEKLSLWLQLTKKEIIVELFFKYKNRI
jgi:hypothetical protein